MAGRAAPKDRRARTAIQIARNRAEEVVAPARAFGWTIVALGTGGNGRAWLDIVAGSGRLLVTCALVVGGRASERPEGQ
jgi:hypothetical protein